MATQPPQAKKGILQEFKEFLNQGDFVTIAVGLIIALYFQQIINAILVGVLFPIIAAIFGKPDYRNIGFDIGDARISIGLVIDAIVSFVLVAFLLFLILKAYDRMRRSREQPDADTELTVLREIRDELQRGREAS